MEIGLSTLVWVLLILIVIKFWRNIVNLIGGLVWFGVFILIAIFIITNFTTLNIDKYVDIGFYDDIRRGDSDYLVEKKDTAFDSALKLKDDINTIGTEDDAFKKEEESAESAEGGTGTGDDESSVSNTESVESMSHSQVSSITESNLNFNDESKGKEDLDTLDSESEQEANKSKEDSEGVTEEGLEELEGDKQGGLVSYDEVDSYLSKIGGGMNEDTKNLVRNLSPYVTWKYSDGDWNIESTSEGIIIEEL